MQYSRENTCVRVSFLEHVFWTTSANGCIWWRYRNRGCCTFRWCSNGCFCFLIRAENVKIWGTSRDSSKPKKRSEKLVGKMKDKMISQCVKYMKTFLLSYKYLPARVIVGHTIMLRWEKLSKNIFLLILLW